MLRKTLLTGAVLCFGAGLALAQSPGGINNVPQVGVNSSNVRQNTYSAVSVGLVPASSATDLACLNASSTKSIHVRKISIDGTAGTFITTPFLLNRNAVLDTSGTPATGLALPVAGKNSSSNPASTATLTAYTANPTVNDASPTLLRANNVALGKSGTSGDNSYVLTWTFGTDDDYDQGADLAKNSTQQLCVNLNGVSVSSGVLDIWFTWTEE